MALMSHFLFLVAWHPASHVPVSGVPPLVCPGVPTSHVPVSGVLLVSHFLCPSVLSWCPTFSCPSVRCPPGVPLLYCSGVSPSHSCPIPPLMSWCLVSLLVSHFSCPGVLVSCPGVPPPHVPSHFSCPSVWCPPGVPLLLFQCPSVLFWCPTSHVPPDVLLLMSWCPTFSCPGVQHFSIQCPASCVLVSHFSCPGIPHLISQCPTFLWFLHNVFNDFWVTVLLALVYSESLNLLVLY
ncbi:hypothetical protein V8B97DRAFT_1992058 [Scleroderma yunnanense]